MACHHGNHILATYLESDAKEDIVEEKEGHASFGHFRLMSIAFLLVVPDHHRDDQVTEALACCCVHEQLPSAPALDVGDADGREE